MKITITYQKFDIYDFEVMYDNFKKINEQEKENTLIQMVYLILENFNDRLENKYDLTLFYYNSLKETIKKYEEVEKYEECHILQQLIEIVKNKTKRDKLNLYISERAS